MRNKIYLILSFIPQQRLSSFLYLKNHVNCETFSGGRFSVRISEEGKLQITSNVKQLDWNVMFENKM